MALRATTYSMNYFLCKERKDKIEIIDMTSMYTITVSPASHPGKTYGTVAITNFHS